MPREMEIDGRTITLNQQQEAAVVDMLAWFASKSKKPYILQGFAGTGKTTLLKILIHSLGIPLAKIALIAPTNRAAKVLANKTGLITRTAFSLLYATSSDEIEFERSRLRTWEESLSFAQLGINLLEYSIGESVEEEYKRFCAETSEAPTEDGLESFKQSRIKIMLEFEGIILPDEMNERQKLFEKLQSERIKLHRGNVTSLLKQDLQYQKRDPAEVAKIAEVILCDEASMINESTGNDLVECSVPLIFVGDPFQLPPVKAKAFWDGKRADAMLTKIERQKGLGAGIPLVGEAIRNGKRIQSNESVSIYQRNRLPVAIWLEADQIICGTHRTREKLCNYVRENLGRRENFPQPGEKIVAVYNDRARGIMNGELYTIKESRLNRGGATFIATLLDPYGKEIPDIEIWVKGLGGRSQTDYLDATFGKFWYGYAITCHQSQGSEWPNVVVCDDWPGTKDRDRWLYTAITRASGHVHLISDLV